MQDSVILKYNLNENGDPISVRITGELRQVPPHTFLTQLSQLPDELQGIDAYLIGSGGSKTRLTEYPFHKELATNTFKVSYATGLIYFHSSLAGKQVSFDYYGRGVEMLHANRIAMEDGNVLGVETLNELIKLNEQAIVSINTINNNFDEILNDVTVYANDIKSQVESTAYQYQNEIIAKSNDVMTKMNDIVVEIDDLAYTTTRSINTIYTNIQKLASDKTKEFQVVFDKFDQDVTAYKNAIDIKAQEVMTHLNNVKNSIDQEFNKAKLIVEQKRDVALGDIDKQVEIVEEYVDNTKSKSNDEFNKFVEYINERKAEMQEIIDGAMSTVNNLIDIFEGHELERQAIFNDSQLERTKIFGDSSDAKDTDFSTSQSNRQKDFNRVQSTQQETFEQAEQARQEEYEFWRDLILDENAISNLQGQVDKQIDEVTSEDVLELQYDENGLVTGTIGGQKLTFYTNTVNSKGEKVKQKIAEHLISGKQSTYFGTDEPIDVDQVWYDPSDEDASEIKLPENIALSQFQDTVNTIRDEVQTIRQTTKLEDLMPGTFFGDGSNSTDIDENSSTVKHVRIKVGSNINLRQLKEGEMAYCVDTEKLYIGVRKSPVSTLVENKVIGGKQSDDTGNNGGNLTGEYLELNGKDGKKYRVFIDEDGLLKQRESDYLTAEPPKVSEPGVGARFKGLIINRYFGGGARSNGKSPLSHGFIELYNNSSNGQTFNLKGLCVYYKTLDNGIWRRLPLQGYLPAQHSYLIRGASVNDPKNSTCRYAIKQFDQHWDMEFSNKSAMVYLGVDNGEITIANPFYLNDGTQMPGYIDLLATSSEEETRSLNALEYDTKKAPYYRKHLSEDRGVQRVDFNDTDNAYVDYESVNYRTCDMSIYFPRCVEDGEWDLYYNKTKLNENIPNLLNMQYGKEWHTRTFTWQSRVMDKGYLRYRKAGDVKWNYVDTNREIVYHVDQDATIHRCIVRNLEEGFYEYQAGCEGYWGDVNEFEVKSYRNSSNVADNTQSLKFLQVSDQQALVETDYEAWRWAVKYIEDNEKTEDFDFIINTGVTYSSLYL